MYQNRIHRPSANRNPQFFIRNADIAYDERIAFVDRVCAVLVESRFGPGFVYERMAAPGDRPELEPAAVFCDLPVGELMPCDTLPQLGRKRHRAVETALRKAQQRSLLSVGPNGSVAGVESAPNLGRGSP